MFSIHGFKMTIYTFFYGRNLYRFFFHSFFSFQTFPVEWTKCLVMTGGEETEYWNKENSYNYRSTPEIESVSVFLCIVTSNILYYIDSSSSLLLQKLCDKTLDCGKFVSRGSRLLLTATWYLVFSYEQS